MKLLAVVIVAIAGAALLIFTAPGQGALRAFGVPAPECIQADVLNAIGIRVPQCTCGNCSSQ